MDACRGTGTSSWGLLPRWGARHWFLAATEDLDDAHRTAPARAWFTQGERDDLGLRFCHGNRFSRRAAEVRTDPVDIHLAGRAGQQAIVPDAVEPVWQDMESGRTWIRNRRMNSGVARRMTLERSPGLTR
jgi:hypothetical protein